MAAALVIQALQRFFQVLRTQNLNVSAGNLNAAERGWNYPLLIGVVRNARRRTPSRGIGGFQRRRTRDHEYEE